MGKKQEKFSVPVIGGSSLLVIFAVLCLTVFALLTLSTVQADLRLSEQSARAVSGYYEADVQAQTILAGLRQGKIPEGVELSAVATQTAQGAPGALATVCSYACPISDTQELRVEVRLDGDSYTVLRWQAASTVDWESDDSLEVWDGFS